MASVEMEELPYVVWYQCRMCTHVFLDDIEKMFCHLEKRHGAMIDCEELRDVVFKNGLSMGGLPRLKKEKIGGDEEGLETRQFLPRPRVIESEASFGENEMVLVTPEAGEEEDEVNGSHDDGDYEDAYGYQQNGDNGEQLGYNYDDEEQLPEDDPDLKLNLYYQNGEEGGNGENGDEYMEADDDAQDQEEEEGSYNNSSSGFAEDEEQANEEHYYYGEQEDGELIVATDYLADGDGQIYEEEDDEEVEEEEEEEEVYREGSHPNGNGNAAQNDQNLLKGIGYSCKVCGKFFTTRRGVETHEVRHKNESSAALSSSGGGGRRTFEPRLYPCKLCKRKSFQSFKDLKIHVKSHTDERIHICRFCCQTFSNTASLTKHLNIHKNENPYKCFCGKTFVSANTLKIHRKIHTGIKPFVCNFHGCGRAFVTKSTLESHVRTHTGEKPYQCNYCVSSFTTSSAKYRHERHVHKIVDGQE